MVFSVVKDKVNSFVLRTIQNSLTTPKYYEFSAKSKEVLLIGSSDGGNVSPNNFIGASVPVPCNMTCYMYVARNSVNVEARLACAIRIHLCGRSWLLLNYMGTI